MSCTAYCIWSVISSFSNLIRSSSSLGFFYHVPLKRDQGDWDCRLRLHDTSNAIGCTGWRRTIGCLMLQVIFHKRATKYRAFWREMTYKNKASSGSSPPCIIQMCEYVTYVLIECIYRIHLQRISYMYIDTYMYVLIEGYIEHILCGCTTYTTYLQGMSTEPLHIYTSHIHKERL